MVSLDDRRSPHQSMHMNSQQDKGRLLNKCSIFQVLFTIDSVAHRKESLS